MVKLSHSDGGYKVTEGKAWPPDIDGIPKNLDSLLKWLDAKVNKSKLVWLRDADGTISLSVMRESESGAKYAPRFWPGHALYILSDDGRARAAISGEAAFVIQWVAVDRADKALMMIKNYALYHEPLET